MATTHLSKRPYTGSQPPITSYFSPGPSTTPTPSPLHAQLPANIQSNLLTVGMRIRKSVPEGYKTGAVYSAFTLFSDSPVQAEVMVKGNSKGRPRARELTPFCGVLRVGGLAQQNFGEEEEEWMPGLSQGSTVSNDSDGFYEEGSGNKRRFVEDEVEGDVSLGLAGFGEERVFAVPRKRKMGGLGVERDGGKIGCGQENENVVRSFAFGVEGDFEEAEFLDYGCLGEVEMGGV